ncbi:MAG: tRNA (adenosine(37)-N6)-threonylcarbamoyltransferase complex ATPase subunit type 1 TsaE [Clostridia bacterium]|nr:tRNA (adenosine(37)-N6)-threonylcarbamoyltransferase complex ATPase subunit type 1 TsaE [Clostridia bacterium]
MKKIFSAKNIAGAAVFTALSFVAYLLEFPIFPAAPFLKLDFSNVFLMLGGFMYGPVPAVVMLIIRELIHIPIGATGGVGELANFLVGFSFVIVPACVYKYRKGIKRVVLTLVIGCVLQIAVASLCNKFILFPFFGLDKGAFDSLLGYIIAFNGIKSVVISLFTVLLYKKVSFLFKRINLKEVDGKVVKSEDGFISKSPEETEEFAVNFAKNLARGTVLLLSGDLGAGKTVFVKGLAKGLGITDEVTSPTYAYLNVYGDLLYHYDCYRLSSGEDAEALGLTDYFGEDNICVIEWAENIKDVLPSAVTTVKIEKISENERKIIVL